MAFQLSFDPANLPEKLAIPDQVLLLGSCFSESIGEQLQRHKWKALINPFGTIYNPVSIFRLISASMENQDLGDSIFQWQEVYYSWDTHSALSHPSPARLRELVADAQSQVRDTLDQRPWIIITPGTAWVYELVESGRLVANCHGYPSPSFRKRLLAPSEIMEVFEKVHGLAVGARWLFTISPVRHVRDGLVENNRSKAVLIQAVHDIVARYDNCFYFPSYEIMIDELRDYRFSGEDLVHPNALAIDYIWQRLCEKWLDAEAQDFIAKWAKIVSALGHRARHPKSATHQKFLHATILSLKRLENKVDITDELNQLQSQLNT